MTALETELARSNESIIHIEHSLDNLRRELVDSVQSLRHDFSSFQQANRPNLLGIVSALVAVLGLLGMLCFSFLNSRVSPIEVGVTSLEKQSVLKHAELDANLTRETARNESRHLGQQTQIAVLVEKLDKLSDRISMNDGRIDSLMRDAARHEADLRQLLHKP